MPFTRSELNIQQFHDLTGADRAAIKKWFAEAGLESVRMEILAGNEVHFYDRDKGLAIIEPKTRKREQKATSANIDPETGLTWAQRKSKEEGRRIKLINDEKERQISRKWITQDENLRRIRAITGKLEQLPGKFKSQFAISDAQTEGLRRMLDEAREGAAQEIEA